MKSTVKKALKCPHSPAEVLQFFGEKKDSISRNQNLPRNENKTKQNQTTIVHVFKKKFPYQTIMLIGRGSIKHIKYDISIQTL